jgi:hypothetical protein
MGVLIALLVGLVDEKFADSIGVASDAVAAD